MTLGLDADFDTQRTKGGGERSPGPPITYNA